MERIAIQHFNQTSLRTYYLNFDETGDRSQEFLDVLMDSLLEFVFGINYRNVNNPQEHQRFFNACEKLYKDPLSRNSQKEGDLGEIILHTLLRKYMGTIPFTGRLYFSVDKNTSPKSFDIIHILPNEAKNILVLGESKMYREAKPAIDALVGDIKAHFKSDYARKQFVRISELTNSDNSQDQTEIILPMRQTINEWELKLRPNKKKLEDIVDELYVPLLCTYTYDDYNNHKKICDEFIKNYEAEMQELHRYFTAKDYDCPNCLNILLMLFPVPCKDTLIEEYYKRIDEAGKVD